MTAEEFRQKLYAASNDFKDFREFAEQYCEQGISFPEPVGYREFPSAWKTSLLQSLSTLRNSIVSDLQDLEPID